MSLAQKELAFFETAPDHPDVRLFIELLDDKRWRTAPEIASIIFTRTNAPGYPGVQWSTDKINSLAQAACPQIISGQKGYKLTRHSTADEVDHFYNQMSSRGSAMVDRAIKTKKYFHQIIG